MNRQWRNTGAGGYVAVAAAAAAIVSLVRFAGWAPSHGAMDGWIVGALVVALALTGLLFFKAHAYVMIGLTSCYTLAMARLLSISVGSFVDALKGINMFGDSSQVGTILSIAGLMLASVLLSIVAGFLKHTK